MSDETPKIIPPAVPRLPQPEWPKTNCTACGKPIVWAQDTDGNMIPLDPRPVTYAVKLAGERARCLNSKDYLSRCNAKGIGIMVTHFATCPNVAQIKAKQRGGDATEWIV